MKLFGENKSSEKVLQQNNKVPQILEDAEQLNRQKVCPDDFDNEQIHMSITY